MFEFTAFLLPEEIVAPALNPWVVVSGVKTVARAESVVVRMSRVVLVVFSVNTRLFTNLPHLSRESDAIAAMHSRFFASSDVSHPATSWLTLIGSAATRNWFSSSRCLTRDPQPASIAPTANIPTIRFMCAPPAIVLVDEGGHR